VILQPDNKNGIGLDVRIIIYAMSVAVVTDSVACLPFELAEKWNIKVVPMEITHNGRSYRDGIDLTPDHFYELLASSSRLPTTSAPSPAEYLRIFKELVSENKEVLVICPFHKLTHVYESATVAAGMLKEEIPGSRVEVIDSGTAAGAQGFVVLDAARAAQEGSSLAEVLNVARETMKKVHVIVFFDTLYYIAKSGRVPYLVSWAGSLLQMKPLVEVKPLGGGVVPAGAVRTRQRAIERLLQIIQERLSKTFARIVVQHTGCIEDAEIFMQRIKDVISCSEIYIQDFTPVMGLHTGPGLLGISYCS